MKRDFSDAAREKLLSLVAQVESEKYCDFTDWIGDRWYDFESWIGNLNIKNYLNNVNDYHKKVIDKNNATAEKIETIFENVGNVNSQYTSRLNALLAELRQYRTLIKMLTAFVKPGNGNFNAQFIGTGLSKAVNEYLQDSKYRLAIANAGIKESDIENMGEERLQRILRTCAAVILENVPDVEIGGEIEMPVGPGVSFYYKVSGEVEGMGDIDLNYIIQDQKLVLENLNYTYEIGNGSSIEFGSDGTLTVTTSGENPTTTKISAYELEASIKEVIGPYTYTFNYGLDAFKGEIFAEEEVKAELANGSVSSTIGVKFENNANWKPLPQPEVVPVEVPNALPDYDADWGSCRDIVVVGLAAAIALAGICLIPVTGGASAILIAV